MNGQNLDGDERELIWRAPVPGRLGLAAVPAAAAAIATLWHDHSTDALGPASWIFAGVMGVMSLLGIAFAILPAELRANERGVTWRGAGRTRRHAWSDIEAIGLAFPRSWAGYDRPVVRFLTRQSSAQLKRRAAPRIGLTLKPGASPIKNPATRAYRLGFTGYEESLLNIYGRDTGEIVAALQARLEAARRTT